MYCVFVVWNSWELCDFGFDFGTYCREGLHLLVLLGLGRILSDRLSPPYPPILGDLLISGGTRRNRLDLLLGGGFLGFFGEFLLDVRVTRYG